jgi:hypothetical protein
METLILVLMLVSGNTMSRPVPAASCPAIAAKLITLPQVTTAWCEELKSGRVVFSTVSL